MKNYCQGRADMKNDTSDDRLQEADMSQNWKEVKRVKKEFFFSIIVPVYNGEMYLDACIEGIRKQEYRNFELIFVDDGSTDASLEKLSRAVDEMDNVRVIRNRHGGVCRARNTGLESANGDYVCFVDADDMIYEDYLKELNLAAQRFDPDVMYFYLKYGVDAIPRESYPGESVYALDAEDIALLSKATIYHVPEMYQEGSRLLGISSFSTGGQVYRRDIYMQNAIRYSEGITLSEDGLMNLQLLHKAKSGVVIRKALYAYRTDNVSATRSYKQNMEEMFEVRNERVKDVIGCLYSVDIDAYMTMYYCSLIYQLRVISKNCIFHSKNAEPFTQKRKRFLDLISHQDYSFAVENCGDCYLQEEDRRYLNYAKGKKVTGIILNMKLNNARVRTKQLIRKMLIRLHCYEAVRNCRKLIRSCLRCS